MVNSLADIIQYIRIHSYDGSYNSIESTELKTIHPKPCFPKIAFTLDISEFLNNLTDVESVMFTFKNSSDLDSIDVKIVDRQEHAFRPTQRKIATGGKIFTANKLNLTMPLLVLLKNLL